MTETFHSFRQPKQDMPPKFVRRVEINRKLRKKLDAAAHQEDTLRSLAERKAWADDEARGTRYAKRATVSQQKRRKSARRAFPHGWKGGRP